jgi:adenosylcobinamide kinase/adenosylcobinamide-phosphate guanylyltransferase
MAERIARHRADRGGGWRTVEAPLALVEALAGLRAGDVAVVDCLTLWLANSMADSAGHAARIEALPRALAACPARLWVISNEVGWGIVPDNALARRFRDEAGLLHQRVAAVAADTLLVVAGQVLRLERG